MKRWLLPLVTMLIFYSAPTIAVSDGELTDAQAAKTVSDIMTEFFDWKLYLGDFRLVKGKTDFAGGTINEAVLDNYEMWARAGVLRVEKSQISPQEIRGLANAQEIHLARVRVSATTSAEKYLVSGKGRPHLSVRRVVFVVNKVVGNTEQRIAADVYRIILCVVTATTTDAQIRLVRASNPEKNLSFDPSEKKLRVLLKYDPFNSKWKLGTFDEAPKDEDFNSDSVNQNLIILKRAN